MGEFRFMEGRFVCVPVPTGSNAAAAPNQPQQPPSTALPHAGGQVGRDGRFPPAPAPAGAVPLCGSSSLRRRRARALPLPLPQAPEDAGDGSPCPCPRRRRRSVPPTALSMVGGVGRSGPSRPRRAPLGGPLTRIPGLGRGSGRRVNAPPAARAARAPGAEQRAAAAIARGSRPRPCPGTIKLLLRAPGAGRRASPFPARPSFSSSSAAAASGPAPGAWRSRAGWTAPRCPRAGRRKR